MSIKTILAVAVLSVAAFSVQAATAPKAPASAASAAHVVKSSKKHVANKKVVKPVAKAASAAK